MRLFLFAKEISDRGVNFAILVAGSIAVFAYVWGSALLWFARSIGPSEPPIVLMLVFISVVGVFLPLTVFLSSLTPRPSSLVAGLAGLMGVVFFLAGHGLEYEKYRLISAVAGLLAFAITVRLCSEWLAEKYPRTLA